MDLFRDLAKLNLESLANSHEFELLSLSDIGITQDTLQGLGNQNSNRGFSSHIEKLEIVSSLQDFLKEFNHTRKTVRTSIAKEVYNYSEARLSKLTSYKID